MMKACLADVCLGRLPEMQETGDTGESEGPGIRGFWRSSYCPGTLYTVGRTWVCGEQLVIFSTIAFTTYHCMA